VPRKETTKKTPEQTRPTNRIGMVKITSKYTGDLTNEIRKRAYELYLERGYRHGNDLGDWYRAEAEIKRKQSVLQH